MEITTTGRRSGRPRRIETRPDFTLHVNGLDVPARARPVTDAELD